LARIVLYALLVAVTAVIFRLSLETLFRLALDDERYSYIVLLPPITLALVLLRRRVIFSAPEFCPAIAIPLGALGVWMFLKLHPASNSSELTATIFGVAAIWILGFVFLFGIRSAAAACFPLGILFLIVPPPPPAMSHVAALLQQGSAYSSSVLFGLFHIPAMRQGMVISLPGFDIEVAEQCSGIRSSIALTLASGVASWILLKSVANRIVVVLITVPIVIFKNAVRITTLSTLALYINRGFLFGRLHRYGGLPFSLLDLAIVVPLLLLLRKSEASKSPQRGFGVLPVEGFPEFDPIPKA
jgi:exosortase